MPDINSRLIYRPFGAFRLLLAGLVVAQHFVANLAPDSFARAAAPYEVGSIAVLVFFTLSGFVIAEAADRVYADRPLAFFANRLLRIAPHFVLAALLSFLVIAWFDHVGTLRATRDGLMISADAFGPRNVLANLFGFAPLTDRLMSTNVLEIGWAVRIEMAFYVAAMAWIAVRSRAPATWTIGAVAVALFCLAIAGHAPGTFSYAPYFIFGAALYGALTTKMRALWFIAGVATAGMAAQLITEPRVHHLPGDIRALRTMAAILAGLIAAMVVLAMRRAGSWKRIDRRLGDLTYPLYLYHQAVMVAVLSLTSGDTWWAVSAATLASLVLSAVMEAIVGRAVDRWRDRVRGRGAATASEARRAPVHLAAE